MLVFKFCLFLSFPLKRDFFVLRSQTDSGPGIQAALNYYSDQDNRWNIGDVFATPAHVFLPGGTYTLKTKLDLRLGSLIMGDPQNMPVLKADAGFSAGILVQGYDGM